MAKVEIGRDLMVKHGYIKNDFDAEKGAAPEFLEQAAKKTSVLWEQGWLMDLTSELDRLHESAESYYMGGDYRCAETVMKVILENFETGMPETIWNLASGLPGGIGGSGCVCGALAGGSMALGLFFGRKGPEDREIPRSMALSRELHDIFKAKHKVACCRVLIREVRGWIARAPAEMREDHG